MVSDLTGYFTLGASFAAAIALAFIVNLFLGFSVADLGITYPKAGGLYDYAKAIFRGRFGAFLGVFLGLTFFGMYALAASGETAAGALGLQALFHSSLHVNVFIILLSVLAVIPNIFGLKAASWVNAGLLILMIGIRWMFGILGFLGLSSTGQWSAANLASEVSLWDWFGPSGILAGGLTLAFWSFVGIEFACSLVEEVQIPRRALPRGIISGLALILLTSLVMGFGITGTQPLPVWQELMVSEAACTGSCPQLAVGQAMFGNAGYTLMALSSVAAAMGSLIVGYSTMPRVLYSIARDSNFFGPLSRPFSKLHPRYGTPIIATLFTLVLYVVPALHSSEVIQWLYSAAYVWILLYVVFHMLAIASRKFRPELPRAFTGAWFVPMATAGVALTLVTLYYAFAGSHAEFGGRALVVILAALAAAVVSLAISPKEAVMPLETANQGLVGAVRDQETNP
ncbi:MAG: APC family permease [Leptolyngbyaceae cyanobacterium SM1_1_3]|nr:APC family permease [Leptolyngbyaceae cyanobacterium SM1_1_3]NJO11963.1 APC family permease [Leptolyngbyaceae cyanobacterium SL_1_1]